MKFAVIGHPVSHSISPAIHGAAYRALGMAHAYTAIDCPDEAAVQRVVEAVRSGELAGVNVTVPWKRTALALADRSDASAAALGAANVLLKDGDVVVAHNTDATALTSELAEGVAASGVGRTSLHACVIGAGGAALAAVVASRGAGASEIVVTARKWLPDVELARWPSAEEFRRLGATPMAWPTDAASREAWQRACRAADFVVQATTAGMRGGPDGGPVSRLVPWAQTSSHCFGYDVVYNPPVTPFLQAAQQASRGHRGGLGMLVGQAADAFHLWLDVAAPRGAMTQAANAVLFGGAGA